MGAGGLGPKNIASLVPYFFFLYRIFAHRSTPAGPPLHSPPTTTQNGSRGRPPLLPASKEYKDEWWSRVWWRRVCLVMRPSRNRANSGMFEDGPVLHCTQAQHARRKCGSLLPRRPKASTQCKPPRFRFRLLSGGRPRTSGEKWEDTELDVH